jgi:hypothetical protein
MNQMRRLIQGILLTTAMATMVHADRSCIVSKADCKMTAATASDAMADMPCCHKEAPKVEQSVCDCVNDDAMSTQPVSQTSLSQSIALNAPTAIAPAAPVLFQPSYALTPQNNYFDPIEIHAFFQNLTI